MRPLNSIVRCHMRSVDEVLAYATLNSNLTLLRSYKTKYLQQAVRVRNTVSFAYQHGGASLLDLELVGRTLEEKDAEDVLLELGGVHLPAQDVRGSE